MPIDLHLGPDRGDVTGLIDQKRRALDAHIVSPVHAFGDPHPIALGDLGAEVGGKLEVQLVLGAKFGVRLEAVRAHADHHGVAAMKLLKVVLEGTGLLSAAAGVVFGIKVQDDVVATAVLT